MNVLMGAADEEQLVRLERSTTDNFSQMVLPL